MAHYCSTSFRMKTCNIVGLQTKIHDLINYPASISAFVASWFTPSSLFLFVNLVIGTIAITSRFATSKRPHDHEPSSSPSPHLVRSSSLLERFRSFHFIHYNKNDTAFPETEYLQPQLLRTPSLLERVKSFNFGLYNNNCYEPNGPELTDPVTVRPDEDPTTQSQLARTPSLLERLKSINFSSLCRSESIKAEREVEVEDDAPEPKSDRDSGNLVRRSKSETERESPARFPAKMKKSASEKAASRRREEGEEEEEVRVVERRRPETARGETRNGEGSGTASFGEDEAVDEKADDFINKFKQQLRLQRLDSILRYREMLTGN
ncbi:pathogen-associated molecular patterns-induced protein A70-like [Senna tora]|uniref:Pathogen-associated molecular patterns-induced protein A70-like n=1 Tax=Senna tora TaxID=362788 RepID=A0A834X3J6_9FABA|nr:pathogen-associated molecular patterns-induced protein A70-like [Senna tora]